MTNLFKAKQQPEPTDVATIRELRSALSNLNASIASADELKPDALHRVELAAAAFRKSMSDIIGGRDDVSETFRERSRHISDAVVAYVTTASGKTTVGGEPASERSLEEDFRASAAGLATLVHVEVPNLEFQSVRAQLRRAGEAIDDAIGKYIEERESQWRRHIERQRASDEMLVTARKLPFVGPTIEVLERLMESMDREPDQTTYMHAANAVPSLLAQLLQLPDVYAKLGGNVTTNDIVEAIRRQMEKKVAA